MQRNSLVLPSTFLATEQEEALLTWSAISKHYGSDWTESGIEHFFRPLKKNATSIRKMVDRDEDAANFNHNAVS
jgi:hypothetical protein